MKKLYIIKAGTTFPKTLKENGDFDKWVIDTLDNDTLQICVIDVLKETTLPKSEECLGVIITGSHSMVSDELPWSTKIEGWLPKLIAKDVPILGICYGHQLLAKSMGGACGYHMAGIELGTRVIQLSEAGKKDILFEHVKNQFTAHTVHAQTFLDLPKGAVRLAYNEHDQNHAFRIGKCAWGVQFHPEYCESVMRSYIEEVSKEKKYEHINYQILLDAVLDTPESAAVLKKFGQHLLS